MNYPHNSDERFRHLVSVGLELASIKDEDILLEKVLYTARYFLNADAGSIYIREKDRLFFRCAQNDTLRKKLPPGKKLIYTTFSIPIDDKSIAGYAALKGEVLNIKDVYKIEHLAPYRFNTDYDRVSEYRTKSVLTAPLMTSRGMVIGVIQIINAIGHEGEFVSFSDADEPFVRHLGNIAASAIERAQLIRSTILRMIKMAELRDPEETGAHVNRVGAYSSEIYETWGKNHNINEGEIERCKDALRLAAMLHDVGKISVPDTILKKPGRLTDEEFEKMKNHTIYGSGIFSDCQSELDRMSKDIARHHHERWDGKGYPDGLQGGEIPLTARIVSVADVYDALSSERSYKKPLSDEEALKIIADESGSHFDDEIVKIFLDIFDTIKSIKARYI